MKPLTENPCLDAGNLSLQIWSSTTWTKVPLWLQSITFSLLWENSSLWLYRLDVGAKKGSKIELPSSSINTFTLTLMDLPQRSSNPFRISRPSRTTSPHWLFTVTGSYLDSTHNLALPEGLEQWSSHYLRQRLCIFKNVRRRRCSPNHYTSTTPWRRYKKSHCSIFYT